jgi:hypothetical protein
MGLLKLWWTGVTHPRQAFDELGAKPAPQWGFWVVLIFNLAISVFTLLPLYLLGSEPLMPSALTFFCRPSSTCWPRYSSCRPCA